MVAQPSIPRPTERLVDFSGLPTPLWYAFLNRAQTVSNDTTALQAEVVALDARVDALEAGGGSFSILGQQSVQVLGTPAGGIVSLQLLGDSIDPGFTMRYGTDTTGAKGWFAESDAFLVVAGELTKAVGSDGVTTYGLADLADAGGGTFRLIVRDAKGRVSGSSAGTTDNVPEGATNLYFTAARVRGTQLTGLSVATGGAIVATDTVLQAFGKLQNEMSLRLTDAPSDSQTYGRKNATWVTTVGEAPIDGSTYGRKDGTWVVVTGGGGGGGTVTSVDGSGGTTGLTLTGGPITGSGTLTLGGTLAVASGGTGATTAAGARTGLGATTVGSNLFTLADPSAIRFLRVNADNTVSALDATTFRTAIGAGTGSGTVTSVAATGSTGLTVGGSPITGSGTITLTLSANLQSWSAIAPSSKADVSALANYVLKAGDTMSGMLTTPRVVLTDQGFSQLTFGGGSYSDVYLWGQTGAGDNVLSLTRAGSSSYAAKFFGSVEATQLKATAESILHFTFGGGAYGTVYAWGQAGAGDDMFNIQRIGTSRYRMNWNGPVQIDGIYTYADSGLRVESNLRQVGSHYNYTANGSGWVRTPRIFVGGSDPGVAAADGDIWIP